MEERDAGRTGHEQQRHESRTCYDLPGTNPVPQIRRRLLQLWSKLPKVDHLQRRQRPGKFVVVA